MAGNLQFYSIFCGVFLYNEKKISTAFVPWTKRISASKNFYDYVSRTYYQNYFNDILRDSDGQKSQRESSFIEHRTLDSILNNPFECETDGIEKVKLSIPYFDCFSFSDGIGIFCFKVEFAEGQSITYESVSQQLGFLRNPLANIISENGPRTVTQFIQQKIEIGFHIPNDWNKYLNQLKLYTIINDPSKKRFTEEEDITLFELSHAMPIGTIRSGMSDKPTDEYFQQILKAHSISVYDNWKAISLLDSFTRLSCDFADPYKSWELDYFHIYIHCLYSKFQLYYFNSQLTDLLQFNKKTQAIRDRFVEFVNDYSLPYISYKFLPNLLYKKISASLEVKEEQEAMEKKIERINETYQNKKSKQLNTLLVVISILSLASVFNDISQWLVNLGASAGWVYNPITILGSLCAMAATGWLIFRRQ
jgi:hypothetical protein